MITPKTLAEFKESVSVNLISDLDSDYEDSNSNLKVQLIESNVLTIPQIDGFSEWRQLNDTKHWYVSSVGEKYVVLNKMNDRVWAAYSLMSVDDFSKVSKSWIRNTINLDNCWISVSQMQRIGKEMGWSEHGIGIKYVDSLSTDVYPSKVSIKAWYGNNRVIDRLLEEAKDNFSINSIRLKSPKHKAPASSEWYSSGKITFHSAEDINDIIYCVSKISNDYNDELKHVTKLRDSEKGSFEFSFKQNVCLDQYSDAVSKGKTDLQLWMMETESSKDFKRFQGVDMHTWDRIFLDMGDRYAYMTIPGKGCVNAAPRLVAVQGEKIMGKTSVYYNGSEVFA